MAAVPTFTALIGTNLLTQMNRKSIFWFVGKLLPGLAKSWNHFYSHLELQLTLKFFPHTHLENGNGIHPQKHLWIRPRSVWLDRDQCSFSSRLSLVWGCTRTTQNWLQCLDWGQQSAVSPLVCWWGRQINFRNWFQFSLTVL